MKKILLTLALCLSLFAPTAALAGEMDMAKATCNDVTNEQELVMIVFWLDGYLTAKTGDTTLSTAWIEELTAAVMTACNANPNTKLMSIVEQ